MHVQEHSTWREGMVTGLIGAGLVAGWFFLVDLAAGQPLRTPNVLGKIFFGATVTPGAGRILPGAVVGYTIVHLIIFALVGIGLTFVVHLASRNIAMRMGVWLGLLVAFLWTVGLLYMLGVATGAQLSLWSIVGGAALGVLGMGGYLWRHHPGLRRSFHEAPLGSEVPPPPHPPGGPRAA